MSQCDAFVRLADVVTESLDSIQDEWFETIKDIFREPELQQATAASMQLTVIQSMSVVVWIYRERGVCPAGLDQVSSTVAVDITYGSGRAEGK